MAKDTEASFTFLKITIQTVSLLEHLLPLFVFD